MTIGLNMGQIPPDWECAAKDHLYAHEHDLGWFDYKKGWVRP